MNLAPGGSHSSPPGPVLRASKAPCLCVSTSGVHKEVPSLSQVAGTEPRTPLGRPELQEQLFVCGPNLFWPYLRLC